ncbi:TetR/AcrR family transcriptional regulator [Cellulomonas sp. KRMCY2]|uniref:TetR/AcrR family transcriptional regulator n=1 Tax=Cellulomonas sp. KRMCY2 TaxID=1304865 RepID=UPI00045E88D5|nr:TetR/AcrR family transcriptional regulator [Cellulomonas sp. KRMCY2]
MPSAEVLRPAVRSVKAPDVRKDEIVAAARALFAERGIAKTSISDVAERAGITRGLVYHYFVDKDTLVDVVLEEYIAEFVESIRRWDAEREVGNIDKALTDCIEVFRRHLQGRDSLGTDLPRIENAGLYNRFVDRAVRAIVDCLSTSTVEAYARRHRIEIVHVYETFYVLVHGLIGLARSRPDIDDAVLVAIVRQTLRLAPGDRSG